MNDIQFIALPKVRGAGNNFAVIVVFFKPGNNNGSIKTAGISEHYFFNFAFVNFH